MIPRLPPLDTKHLALVSLIQLALLRILQPDTFMARDIEGKDMVLKVALILSPVHLHMNGARSERARDVKVHVHDGRTYAVGLGA